MSFSFSSSSSLFYHQRYTLGRRTQHGGLFLGKDSLDLLDSCCTYCIINLQYSKRTLFWARTARLRWPHLSERACQYHDSRLYRSLVLQRKCQDDEHCTAPICTGRCKFQFKARILRGNGAKASIRVWCSLRVDLNQCSL